MTMPLAGADIGEYRPNVRPETVHAIPRPGGIGRRSLSRTTPSSTRSLTETEPTAGVHVPHLALQDGNIRQLPVLSRRRIANSGNALSPVGRGTGREVEPQVSDVVAAEPGDEADGGPQRRRPRVPGDRAADLREA